jgi:Na+/H+-translocating membrane pyrophosphatase
MGADLFESYVGSIIATATLGDGLRGLAGYGIGVNDYQGIARLLLLLLLFVVVVVVVVVVIVVVVVVAEIAQHSRCIAVFGCRRRYSGVDHRRSVRSH